MYTQTLHWMISKWSLQLPIWHIYHSIIVHQQISNWFIEAPQIHYSTTCQLPNCVLECSMCFKVHSIPLNATVSGPHAACTHWASFQMFTARSLHIRNSHTDLLASADNLVGPPNVWERLGNFFLQGEEYLITWPYKSTQKFNHGWIKPWLITFHIRHMTAAKQHALPDPRNFFCTLNDVHWATMAKQSLHMPIWPVQLIACRVLERGQFYADECRKSQ